MLLGKQLSPNHQSITLWASRPVCLEEHLNFDEDDHSKENYEGGDHKDSLATENIPWRHKAVWWYRQISPKNISSRLWMFESETEACLAFVYKGLSAPRISTMMTCPIQNSSFQTHQQEAISLFSTGTSIMVVIDVLFSKQCCSSSPRICRAYREVEPPTPSLLWRKRILLGMIRRTFSLSTSFLLIAVHGGLVKEGINRDHPTSKAAL